jgi:tRNA A37 threonylcarbamoyladenosine biosynthesis protein TsaE
LPLFHIDLYRLEEGATAAHAVDLEELLGDESAVVLIEWAERLGQYPLPANVWRIAISGDGAATRSISLSA